MAKLLKTQSGNHIVYHYTQAGAPEEHLTNVADGGPWFYGPARYDSEDLALGVYSAGYATPEAALAAAEAWEAQQEIERQYINPDYEAMRADLATPEEGE